MNMRELLTCLKEKLFSVRKYKQPLFHFEETRKVCKHYGFAGASRQRHNDTPFTILVGLVDTL
jgi:hypothetical protein